jgi:uncharacterized membrane protein
MEENIKLIETLLERTADYGKTSIDLVKLKALDKTSDVISTLIPHTVVAIIFASSMLFFNLGLAIWLGGILGELFYGFLVLAVFYGIIAIFIFFFLYQWLKKLISNYIIKKVLV